MKQPLSPTELWWRNEARRVRRMYFWREARRWIVWSLIGLAIGLVAVVAVVSSRIDTVI